MILLPRRTFFALSALTVGATVFLLFALAAQHGYGPLARFSRGASARRSMAAMFCPALSGRTPGGDDQGTMDAYMGIEVALKRGSLAAVPENAARIAAAFGGINPDIAASARRLARLRDVAAARREFQRLTDLFSRSSEDPGNDADGEEDEAPAKRSLEV